MSGQKLKWWLSGYLIVLFIGFELLEDLIYKNTSISEPPGYYLSLPYVSYGRGDLVLVCVSDSRYKTILNKLNLKDVSGACSNGLPYLLKQVSAVAGDRVEVSDKGVLINGELQANSYGYASGRGIAFYPLKPRYKHVLGEGEYFMLGISPHSFDSRYFGIVKDKDIYRRVVLLWKIGKKRNASQ